MKSSSPAPEGSAQAPPTPLPTQPQASPAETSPVSSSLNLPASEVVQVLNNMRSTPFAIQWETGNGSSGRAGFRSSGEHFVVFESGQGFIRRGRASWEIGRQPDGSFSLRGSTEQLPYLMSYEIMPPDRIGIGSIMEKLQDSFYETGTADYPIWILNVESVYPKLTPNLQEFERIWISSLAIQMKREDGRLLPIGYAGTYWITSHFPFSGSYTWGEPVLPVDFPQ
jgi:hypothetical protein